MNNEQLETELRSAIRSQAESVHPADRLGAIRARTQGGSVRASWWNRPWLLAAGTGLAAASVVTAAVVLLDTSADAPVAGAEREVTVYEVGEIGKNLWLYPEQVSTQDTGDAGVDAVRALLEHKPTKAGRFSILAECPLGNEVSTVDIAASLITVALTEFTTESGGALCDMSDEGIRARYQQMAWTVRTATGLDRPVRVTIGGQGGEQAVEADPSVLSPVIVESPTDGETVSGPVTVQGTSDTFEANVVWEVKSDDAGVAKGGHTMGGTLGERAPFEFTVDLEPGTYTARAYAEDMETGGLFAEDTTTFTVE